MGRDNWRVERTRHSPWGAVALVALTGLALMRNGADISPGALEYGDTNRAEPRVIACGGGLTKAVGHDGDVVVLGGHALSGAAAP
ncbi:hypothetical protein OG978_37865 [Streptomyces sp. NBC_01591]|nr:hypothetical protein [Streptomyces sp. NBC_01591]WSD72641.1 hypothetical protein OG978_37865 [Streptomyces sp. NBC_01591]